MTKPILSDSEKILESVSTYYTAKVSQHGATPAGVDWKDERSQLLRFAELHKILQNDPLSSLLDIGCGYGAFLPYARAQKFTGHYTGLDCAAAQIEAARTYLAKALPGDKNYELTNASAPQTISDYAIASGIFNVKMHIATEAWRDYIIFQLDLMNAHSRKGFAFNCLTSHVDWRRDDLYYADPDEFLGLCRERFGGQIALLQDYGLYEFTIIARKEA